MKEAFTPTPTPEETPDGTAEPITPVTEPDPTGVKVCRLFELIGIFTPTLGESPEFQKLLAEVRAAL